MMFEEHLFIKGWWGWQKSVEKNPQIIYILAPGANNCRPLVKRDFNGQSFIIYLYI